jgi:hypothetical protein
METSYVITYAIRANCDERSKLGTFIQVRIKDRMAEIETDDIGELHEKVSVSLNESGIGPDSSGGK